MTHIAVPPTSGLPSVGSCNLISVPLFWAVRASLFSYRVSFESLGPCVPIWLRLTGISRGSASHCQTADSSSTTSACLSALWLFLLCIAALLCRVFLSSNARLLLLLVSDLFTLKNLKETGRGRALPVGGTFGRATGSWVLRSTVPGGVPAACPGTCSLMLSAGMADWQGVRVKGSQRALIDRTLFLQPIRLI